MAVGKALGMTGAVLAAALWAGAAMAQVAQSSAVWATYQPPEADFSALFPGAPQVSTQPMGSVAGATLRTYALQSGPEAFNVAIFVYPKGTLPPSLSKEQLDNLAQLFGEGAGKKLRSSVAASVSGRPGIEALLDDPATGEVTIFRAAQMGDRIFTIAYGGEKGTETSPQATRFVSSLVIKK
ncbi:MAG TPA: hypothetical protein VG407_12335 [Caulobacteraceae bacterium]|jgi:hypothetical protein|nr:hypothetical protein [Caulobacteraceae bacterium]